MLIAKMAAVSRGVGLSLGRSALHSQARATTRSVSVSNVLRGTAVASAAKGHDSSLIYGPAVRSLLELYNIQVGDVKPTGPHNRVLKGDVLTLIKSKSLQPVAPAAVAPPEQPVVRPVTHPSVLDLGPAPTAPSVPAATEKPAPAAKPVTKPAVPVLPDEGHTDIPNNNVRMVIAKRLTESKTTVPHSYASIDCNMKEVTKLRKQILEEGVKVSVNDFIVKAAAVALQRIPQANAVWGGQAPRLLSNIDISVAVATENGLITPIVTDAIGRGVAEIAENVRELAGRAREGKLQLHEFQGGSFTISNLGMFGITEFSAVINPPQACILAVGTSRVALDSEGNPQTMMAVTLSSDARIVDDALAAKFLETFREIIENPMTMLSQSSPVNLESLFAK